jgi:hypothetical protein
MINYIVAGQDRRVTLDVLQAIRSFTDAGCMVIGSEHNRGLRWSSLCEQQTTIRFDGSDDDAFVDLVNDLTRYTRHLVLIPADCHAIRLVNRVAGRVSVAITPVPDTPTMDMLDDPWRFQRLCRQHGLPVPASRLLGAESEPDFQTLARELGLPFMLRSASKAVHEADMPVHTRRDLWRAPTSGLLMAQAMPEGVEVTMSLLSDRGQLNAFAIAGLEPTMAPRLRSQLEQLAVRLCHLCAFNGPMRLRARVDTVSGRICLMDCVPHFWPGLTACILSGLNLVAECVQPSPRQHGMRVVTQQHAKLQHPLAPVWWQRLRGRDEGARLLRAMSLDLYSLSLSTGGMLKQALDKVRHKSLVPQLPDLTRGGRRARRMPSR